MLLKRWITISIFNLFRCKWKFELVVLLNNNNNNTELTVSSCKMKKRVGGDTGCQYLDVVQWWGTGQPVLSTHLPVTALSEYAQASKVEPGRREGRRCKFQWVAGMKTHWCKSKAVRSTTDRLVYFYIWLHQFYYAWSFISLNWTISLMFNTSSITIIRCYSTISN